jgi:hypothetical protein
MLALQTMREDELRASVLLLLFRRMGYLGVTEYHGGALEQGKDMVMWRRTEFGRRNFAVVAKATPVSGKAAGAGSAGEVAAQVQQCFRGSFFDASTAEQQSVHECIVVCPYEIKKEARQSILNIVGDAMGRQVAYLHGADLWELVRKHLGTRSAIAQLEELGSVLENASPNYRVVARAQGAQVEVGIQAKHPDAETAEPLRIKAVFKFPNDDRGRTARAAMQRHFDTGSGVTIRREHISSLELPPIMRELYGDDVDSIAIGPGISNFSLKISLRAEAPTTGEVVTTPELDLRATQIGHREATLVGERPPFGVTLALNKEARRYKVTFNFHLRGVNVAEALVALRLQRMLATGCVMSIMDARSNLPILTAPARMDTLDLTIDDTEDLVSDLVEIQDATRTALDLPNDLTPEQVHEIRGVAHALRTGVVPIRLRDATVTLGRAGLQQMLENGSNPAIRMAFVEDEAITIGETRVALGPVARVIDKATICEAELQRLRELDAAVEEVRVNVDCSHADAKALYLRRISPEELQRYREMFPALAARATERSNTAPPSDTVKDA